MKDYKYCPKCKSNLEPSGEHLKCSNCGLGIYKNSKPTCGILPIKDGKVLLSKRAIEPYKGEYDIIGGFLEAGEHPEDGAIREAKEETGLDIKPTEILGIYMDKYGNDGVDTLNIHFIGEIIGGEMNPQEDVASLHWVDINTISVTEGFNNTNEALQDLKKWYNKQN